MDFETRLIQLERSNRRMRVVIAGLAVLLFVSLFLGGKLVASTNASAQSEHLQLKSLVIKNSGGDPVVVLHGDAPRGQNPGIQLRGNNSVFECFDESYRKTVSIGVQTGDIVHKGEHRKGR